MCSLDDKPTFKAERGLSSSPLGRDALHTPRDRHPPRGLKDQIQIEIHDEAREEQRKTPTGVATWRVQRHSRGLFSCILSARNTIQINSLIQDLVMEPGLCKMWAVISCRWVSLSPILSMPFSHTRALAKSRPGSGAASCPRWIRLTLIRLLFLLFLGRFYHLQQQQHLVQLVIPSNTVLSPIPALPFPMTALKRQTVIRRSWSHLSWLTIPSFVKTAGRLEIISFTPYLCFHQQPG